MASVNSNTEFLQVNTTTNAGTINLPNANAVPGRILTVKDIAGNFQNKNCTLATSAGDTFENGATTKVLTEQFGYLTLASDGVNKWYFLDGTSMNTYTVNYLTNPLATNTNFISTANTSVSTLGFVDRSFNRVSTLYTESTLLYLGSNVIGGSKCGPTQFIPTRAPFAPNQLTGLNLWIDASDPNTFTYTTGNVITNIYDKSGGRSFVNTFDGTSVVYEPRGLLGMPSFNMVNGHFRGTISASRPMTRYTNTTFIVTQLITSPSDGYPCMALSESLNGSSSNVFRALDYRPPASGNVFRTVLYFGSPLPAATVTFTTAQVGSPFIVNANYSAAANGNTLFMRYNGDSSVVTTQNVATAPTTTATNFFIGSDGFTSVITTNTWTGRISEVLMYNVQLTVAQQAQVEGYLAWKWNLVSNLPVTHPYKYSPP
jgi:hypothetical protein